MTAPNYETLRRELGRAIRSGLDAEVELILSQLGDDAVRALDSLEDCGSVAPQAWGPDV
jgi:hypothetical protein